MGTENGKRKTEICEYARAELNSFKLCRAGAGSKLRLSENRINLFIMSSESN